MFGALGCVPPDFPGIAAAAMNGAAASPAAVVVRKSRRDQPAAESSSMNLLTWNLFRAVGAGTLADFADLLTSEALARPALARWRRSANVAGAGTALSGVSYQRKVAAIPGPLKLRRSTALPDFIL